MTATLLPNAKQQFLDTNGRPLAGGQVYFYIPNTSTLKNTWQDAGQITLNTNPVVLDANGQAIIYGSGQYRQVVYDVHGNLIWDKLTSSPVTTADLSSTTDATNGAGAIGFNYSLSYAVGTVGKWLKDLANSAGSSFIGFIQSGVGAVLRTMQSKARDTVNIKDFGAVCDGVTDDTAAINAALVAAVDIWIDGTPLITSTITVPAHKKIRFKGGLGNTLGSYPTSYLIKAAAMTTVALKLLDCAVVEGGGLVCQGGNTGDGVALAGNSAKLSHFLSHGAGGVGVRVGTDVGTNTNSCVLDHVTSQWNGSHGIYVHDGSGSDCNTATLTDCFVQHNGGDGIRLGHTYWTTVINCLSEVNTGWGLYLSGNNNATYPECRNATIIGGDYNELNTAGIIFDASYFATILNADFAQTPTTAANGLQGSAARTYLGGMTSQLQGVQVGPQQSTFRMSGGTSSPVKIGVVGTGSVGDGALLTFETSVSGTYHTAAQVGAWQFNTNIDGLNFLVNASGTMTSMMKLVSGYNGLVPGADNTYNLGHPSIRWGTVYAGTGTINTSDEREKQQIQDIEVAALRAVRRIPFKQFKFNDAVALKGDGARWHFGVLAQDVKAAFEAEGLDPFAYGVLCYDEWDAMPAVSDEEGTVLDAARPAGNRYGVRYEELLALKLAAIEAQPI